MKKHTNEKGKTLAGRYRSGFLAALLSLTLFFGNLLSAQTMTSFAGAQDPERVQASGSVGSAHSEGTDLTGDTAGSGAEEEPAPGADEEENGGGQTPGADEGGTGGTDNGQMPGAGEGESGDGQTPGAGEGESGDGQTPGPGEGESGDGQTPGTGEEETGDGQMPGTGEGFAGAGADDAGTTEGAETADETDALTPEEALLSGLSPFIKFSAVLAGGKGALKQESNGSYTLSGISANLRPDFTVDSGPDDMANADGVLVTVSSKNGKVLFAVSPESPFREAVFTTTVQSWKHIDIAVIRNGSGPEEITVSAKLPEGYANNIQTATLKLSLEGWEALNEEYSGKYWTKESGYLKGWKRFNETEDGFVPSDSGVLETYFDETTGEMVSAGLQEIDGKKYWFQTKRETYHGYRQAELNDKTRSDVDKKKFLISSGEMGIYICLNRDGTLETGEVQASDGKKYYFDKTTGIMVTNDWIYWDDGKCFFARADGTYYANGLVDDPRGGVYIIEGGMIQKGWTRLPLNTNTPQDRYYCDPSTGAITFGIITVDKKKYLQIGKDDGSYEEGGVYKSFGGVPQRAGFWYCSALEGPYYTDENGIVASDKEVTLNGKAYYVNPDGTMFTGYKRVKEGKVWKTYLYTQTGREDVTEADCPKALDPEDTDAVIGYGYQDKNGNLVFYEDTGKTKVLQNRRAILKIDGYPSVILNVKGQLSYGFVTLDGKKYYCDRQTGYVMGSPGLREIDGQLWFFHNDDYVAQPENEAERWVKHPSYSDNHYYIGADGKPLTGWQTLNGKKYYFEKNGIQNRTGFIGGKYYILVGSDKNVETVPGIHNMSSSIYYLNPDGSVKTGWVTVTSTEDPVYAGVYYTPPSRPEYGVVKEGIYRIGKKYYAFDENGKRLTGWKRSLHDSPRFNRWYVDAATGTRLGGVPYAQWFYFDAKGVMATGKKNVPEANPEFSSAKGVLYFGTGAPTEDAEQYPGMWLRGTVIRSGNRLVMLDWSGKEMTEPTDGLQYSPDGSTYCIVRGKPSAGAKTVGGQQYYFDKDSGKMVRDTLVNISGKWYYYGPDGVRKTDNLFAVRIDRDGELHEDVQAVFHKKGFITKWTVSGVTLAEARLVIGGKTYFLNNKGVPVKGLYTQKEGTDKGTSWLIGADYTLRQSAGNALVKSGKQYYVTDGAGRLLKNGIVQVKTSSRYPFSDVLSVEEQHELLATVLPGTYRYDGGMLTFTFRTDKNGAVIRNKTVTADNGQKMQLGTLGLPAGPLYRVSGKWYVYDPGTGCALRPGTYQVEAYLLDMGKRATLTFKVDANGRITQGFRLPDGSAAKGLVAMEMTGTGGAFWSDYYYLDKKGMPQTGTKSTSEGKLTFHKQTGGAGVGNL